MSVFLYLSDIKVRTEKQGRRLIAELGPAHMVIDKDGHRSKKGVSDDDYKPILSLKIEGKGMREDGKNF